MSKVVIEVIAKAKHTSEEDINMLEGHTCGILSSNVERNFSGFLVKKDIVTYKIGSQTLLALIALLKDQLLLAKFVGPKPPP